MHSFVFGLKNEFSIAYENSIKNHEIPEKSNFLNHNILAHTAHGEIINAPNDHHMPLNDILHYARAKGMIFIFRNCIYE